MMTHMFTHIVLLIVPLILSNSLHMLVVKHNTFATLAKPVSQAFFGSNKTYRGFVVLPILTALFVAITSSFWGPFSESHFIDIWIGAGLGFFYILAELPNSYVKRRLGIQNGQHSKKYRVVQLFADRADSLIVVLLFYRFAMNVDFIEIGGLLILTILLHLLVSMILVFLKIKKSI